MSQKASTSVDKVQDPPPDTTELPQWAIPGPPEGDLVLCAKVLHDSIIQQAVLKGKAAIQIATATAKLMDIVLKQATELQNLKSLIIEQAAQPVSYAEVTKGRVEVKPPRPMKEHVLLVFPEDSSKSSGKDEIEKVLKSSIKPKDLNIRINRVSKTKSGGVLIKAPTKGDIEALDNAIKANVDLRVTTVIPKKRQPRMIVKGLGPKTSFDRLAKRIEEQHEIPSGDLVPKFKFDRDNERSWVFEIKSEHYPCLIDKGVHMDWRRVRIVEYLKPTQCFKCGMYGHIAINCKQKEKCYKCGRSGHKAASCNKEVRCRNCTESNSVHRTTYNIGHMMNSNNCPLREQERRILAKRTDYGYTT